MDEQRRPPAHPLLGGESEYVSSAEGWPSHLTDRERGVLMAGALDAIVDNLGVERELAAELLALLGIDDTEQRRERRREEARRDLASMELRWKLAEDQVWEA